MLRWALFFLLACSFSRAGVHDDARPTIVRDPKAKLSDSAISLLLESGKLPPTMDSFKRAMEKNWGPVQTNVVPFSDAPGETNLDEPRKLYGSEAGELFIGTIHREDASVDFEFISRNAKTGKADFGIVRNYGKSNEEAIIINKEACITCHKNEGPLFMKDGWTNTVGNASVTGGLFLAFLERLAIREPKYRPLKEALNKIVPNDADFPNNQNHHLHDKLREQFGALTYWEGMDLLRLVRTSANFEISVVRANQQLVLDGYIREAKTLAERQGRTREVLEKAIHGEFPLDGGHPYYRKFSHLPENRNFILEDRMANVFKARIPNFASSEANFLEYNVRKKSEKWPNTIEEFSPTSESNFVAHSEVLTGRGGSVHFEQLNNVYNEILSENFSDLYAHEQGVDLYVPSTEVTKRVEAKFLVGHPEGLKGDGSQKQQVFKFQHQLEDEFINSAHLKQFIDKGVLPSPTIARNLYREFIVGIPPSRVPVNPERVQTLNKEKKCLDCHSSAEMVGERYVFKFEFSDINSWKAELKSPDPSRVKQARRWLVRTLIHVEKDTMPPPPQFASKLTVVQKKELVDYLKSEAGTRLK